MWRGQAAASGCHLREAGGAQMRLSGCGGALSLCLLLSLSSLFVSDGLECQLWLCVVVEALDARTQNGRYELIDFVYGYALIMFGDLCSRASGSRDTVNAKSKESLHVDYPREKATRGFSKPDSGSTLR